MKYICENKQKCAQSIFCVLVCLYIKVKTEGKKFQKNLMNTFDMVVVSNLHCPPSSSCVLNPSPTSFLSLTFLVFFLTMICLYEWNWEKVPFADILPLAFPHNSKVCLCPEGTCRCLWDEPRVSVAWVTVEMLVIWRSRSLLGSPYECVCPNVVLAM